jgi:hypothetical protein
MSDALASLQTALAPKTGMKRIPFPTESYQHPSLPLSAKRLLNFYIEQAPADALTQTVMRSTPGLAPYGTTGTGPVYAINGDFPGYIYVVSGTQAYRLTFDALGNATVTDIGFVGAPSGPLPALLFVSIAVAAIGAVICVPPNAYTCTHDGTLNQLGGTFPGDASSVAYCDNYFVFTKQNDNQEFFISRLSDPTDFDALDFASAAEAFPNTTTRVTTQGHHLWFSGQSGIEVWYDSGDLDFPFRRLPGIFLEEGTGSPRSVAIGDGSIFWVTASGIAMRSVNFQPQRISQHAIEDIIRYQGPSGIVSALTYSQGGHIFYVINFPTRTIVYDCATKQWHERSSSMDGQSRWRAECCTSKFPILGDSLTGTLLLLDPTLDTDNGQAVMRTTTPAPLHAGTYRGFCNRVEIEMETGGFEPPGNVMLEWSDDGGWTYLYPRMMSAGTTELERRKRVFTTRLGSFRNRVFRITVWQHATIYAVSADTAGGTAG